MNAYFSFAMRLNIPICVCMYLYTYMLVHMCACFGNVRIVDLTSCSLSVMYNVCPVFIIPSSSSTVNFFNQLTFAQTRIVHY